MEEINESLEQFNDYIKKSFVYIDHFLLKNVLYQVSIRNFSFSIKYLIEKQNYLSNTVADYSDKLGIVLHDYAEDDFNAYVNFILKIRILKESLEEYLNGFKFQRLTNKEFSFIQYDLNQYTGKGRGFVRFGYIDSVEYLSIGDCNALINFEVETENRNETRDIIEKIINVCKKYLEQVPFVYSPKKENSHVLVYEYDIEKASFTYPKTN